jgi:hypothetical protein
LTEKKNLLDDVKNKEEESFFKESKPNTNEEDIMQNYLKAIDNELRSLTDNKNVLSTRETDEVFKPNNKSQKGSRQREIILMIEKTFGRTIIHLVFYIFFLIYIMFFLFYKNDTQVQQQLLYTVRDQFLKFNFKLNFTIFDYYTRTTLNNFDLFAPTNYTVETSLFELQDVPQIADWLNLAFFHNLGYHKNTYEFAERHKLIGKVRFFQLRQKKDPKCNPFSQFEMENKVINKKLIYLSLLIYY